MPNTVAEAEQRLMVLKTEVENIVASLVIKRPVGRVSNDEWREYNEWKGKALWAQHKKNQEARWLKSWIKQTKLQNESMARLAAIGKIEAEITEPDLLRAARNLLADILENKGYSEREAWALVHAIGQHLWEHGRARC